METRLRMQTVARLRFRKVRPWIAIVRGYPYSSRPWMPSFWTKKQINIMVLIKERLTMSSDPWGLTDQISPYYPHIFYLKYNLNTSNIQR